MKVYHWSCSDHGVPAIMETGLVMPRDQPLLGVKLSWWSHVPFASRENLGLTSEPGLLHCDRMSAQFAAEPPSGQIISWAVFKRGLVQQKPELAQAVRYLEAPPGAKPNWWWVAPEPIAVKLVLGGAGGHAD